MVMKNSTLNPTHFVPPGQEWYQSGSFAKDGRYKHFNRNKYRQQKRQAVWEENRKKVLGKLGLLTLEDAQDTYNILMEKKRKNAKCYICKRKGHTFWKCKEKQLEEDTNGNQFKMVTLRTNFMVKETDYGNWNTIWYVSNSLSQHIAQTRTVFDEFRFKYHEKIVDGETLLIRGIGHIKLDIGTEKLHIEDVLFCPNVNANILSLSSLRDQGFSIKTNGDKCEITRHDFDMENQIREDLECMERDAAVKLTKGILHNYASKFCDKVGDEKGKGLSNEMHGESSKNTPYRLQGMVEVIDFVLTEKFVYPQVRVSVSRRFDDMLLWFHNSEYMEEKGIELPVIIGSKIVCLMDLFREVKIKGGASLITLEDKWNNVATAMGYPEWYAIKLKTCYVEYLQKLDILYDVVKNTIDDHNVPNVSYNNGEEQALIVKDHKSFMTFMSMMQEDGLAIEFKRFLRSNFEETISWFHRDFIENQGNFEMPPTVNGLEICLFDLYIYLINDGGFETGYDRDWGDVAQRFGFEEKDKYKVKGVVERYLMMPYMYYKCMRKEDQLEENHGIAMEGSTSGVGYSDHVQETFATEETVESEGDNKGVDEDMITDEDDDEMEDNGSDTETRSDDMYVKDLTTYVYVGDEDGA